MLAVQSAEPSVASFGLHSASVRSGATLRWLGALEQFGESTSVWAAG